MRRHHKQAISVLAALIAERGDLPVLQTYGTQLTLGVVHLADSGVPYLRPRRVVMSTAPQFDRPNVYGYFNKPVTPRDATLILDHYLPGALRIINQCRSGSEGRAS